MAQRIVRSSDFYRTYHGHELKHLAIILEALRHHHGPDASCLFLAGDSSLDNKYWLREHRQAINGYEKVLDTAVMKPDVNYWLNYVLAAKPKPAFFALNTAIEATTLGERVGGWIWDSLLEQDGFIRDNICCNDVLVVSIGGNDIALSPTIKTVASIMTLVYTASDDAIANGDAWGLGHFISMFRDQLLRYLTLLLEKQKPRKVLVCMIYYPDVVSTGSWADFALSALDYNNNPKRLQAAISAVFEHAVSKIHIEGTQVVPVPLFERLDGSDPADYIERVEPSMQGGAKMAKLLLQNILE